MRKLILFFVVLLFICNGMVVYANQSTGKQSNNNFTLGAGFVWTNNPELLGGYFDFGIVLYKNILYIQNSIVLRGGGLKLDDGDDYSVFTLSDKIIFGRNTRSPLKIYTYIEGGLGVFGNQSKGFFESPYVYTFGFGGGGELSSEDFGGLFFEVGYIGQQTNLNYLVSGIIIQSGWKIFF